MLIADQIPTAGLLLLDIAVGRPFQPEFGYCKMLFCGWAVAVGCAYFSLSLVLFTFHGHTLASYKNSLMDHLRKFRDVFIFPKDENFGSKFGCHVTLHSTLRTAEDRTIAIGDVVKSLGDKLIPGTF